MKKLILVIVGILLLVGGATAVYAAGLGNSSTESVIAVIGENAEMEVNKPLEVTGWTGIAIDWQEGQTNPVYPGQTIGKGKITILNISPISQVARLSARAIAVGSDVGPALEVIAKSSTDTFRTWGNPIVLRPGEAIDLIIEVKVAYGSPISTFRGVELVVTPGSVSTQEGPRG